MKKIKLTTKEELNIYMSPVRQQLLRQLSISGAPMTPKMLAGKLGISASGAQHHIKKLMSLGLLELDHTEPINGITASYYRPTEVTVQIGLEQNDGLVQQKSALMQDCIAQVYDGFQKQMKKRIDITGIRNSEKLSEWGDIFSGVAYLCENESKELAKLVSGFIEKHSTPGAGRSPWEYAIIAYNAEELPEDAPVAEEATAGNPDNAGSDARMLNSGEPDKGVSENE